MTQTPKNLKQVIIQIVSIQTNYNMIGGSCFQKEGGRFKQNLLLDSSGTAKVAKPSISKQAVYTYQGNSQVGLDFSFSNSEDIEDSSQQSMVSIEQKLLTEHLACLQISISNLNQKLFKIPEHSKYLEMLNPNNHQIDQSLYQYLQQQKSLILPIQVPFFIDFLEGNASLKKIVRWIYEHVQQHLGDQLVLVVHRIVLAYLPVRHLLEGQASIAALSRQAFNLFNIYCHPLLSLVGYGRLYLLVDGVVFIDREMQDFQQSFLETVLLVLEQYFQNPGYQRVSYQIQNKQQENRNYDDAKPFQNSEMMEEQKNQR